MSRRKVINRRSQRYSRVSTDSAIRDVTEILSDEEPFWWTHLEDNPGRRATQLNFSNETTPELDPTMRLGLTPPRSSWWKVLETPNASTRVVPETLSVKSNTIAQTQADSTTSDSETNRPIIQKKKLRLRTKLNRSHESNAFLKVLNNSAQSTTSQPIQSTSKTLTSSNIMQSENIRKRNRKRSYDQENSSSDSPTSERIMKTRPKLFGKQKLSESKNIFDDILREVPPIDSPKITSKLPEANASSIPAREKSTILEENNASSDTVIYSQHSIASNLSFEATEHNSGTAPLPKAQSTMIENTPVRQNILSNNDIESAAIDDRQSELDNRASQKSANNVADILPLIADKSNISLTSERKKSLTKSKSNVSHHSIDRTGDSAMSQNETEAALKPKSRFLNAWRKTEKDILNDTEPESNKTNRNQQRSADTNLGTNVFTDELNQSRDDNNEQPLRKTSAISSSNDSDSDFMIIRREKRSNIDRISESQGANIDFEPDISIHSKQSRHSIVKDHTPTMRRTRSNINVSISSRRARTKEQENASNKFIVDYSDSADEDDPVIEQSKTRRSTRSTYNKQISRVTSNNSTSNLEPPVLNNSGNATTENKRNATLNKSKTVKRTSKSIVNTPPSITRHKRVSSPVISTPISLKRKSKFSIVEDDSDEEITDTKTRKRMRDRKSPEHKPVSDTSTLNTSSHRKNTISKKNETLNEVPGNRSTVFSSKSIVNDSILASSRGRSNIMDSNDSEDEEVVFGPVSNNTSKDISKDSSKDTSKDTSKDRSKSKLHSLASSVSRTRSVRHDNSDIEDDKVSNVSLGKNRHKNQSHGSSNRTIEKKQTSDKTMNRDASRQTNPRLATVQDDAYSGEDSQDLVLQVTEKTEDKQEATHTATNTAPKETVRQTRRSFLSSTRKSTITNKSLTARLSGSISPVANESTADIRRQVLKRNTRSSKQLKMVRRSSRNTSAARTSQDNDTEHGKLDKRENDLPRRSTRSSRVIEEKEADKEYTSPQREDSSSSEKEVAENALNTTPQNLSFNRDFERPEDSPRKDESSHSRIISFSKSKQTEHTSLKATTRSIQLNEQSEKPAEESMKSPMQLSSTPLRGFPKSKHPRKKSPTLGRKSILNATSQNVIAGKQRNIIEFLKTRPEFGLSSILSNPQSASQVTASQVFSNPNLMSEVKKEIADIVKEKERIDTEIEKPSLLSKIASMKLTPKRIKKIVPKPAKPVDKAYLVGGKVYKAPRLIRPKPWVTDRLYRFLWKCMKPRYDLSTRVESEKFIQKLADVVTLVTHRKSYKNYEKELNSLMRTMARLNIIKNRSNFYHFCYDYLPYEFRIKAVPMLLPGNKYNIPYDPDKLYTPLLESP